MTFEAYKISVKVSLINQVSAGLVAMSSQFMRTHKDAIALESQLKKIKLLGLAGGAMGGIGFMGLGVIGKLVKPASEYAHQLQMMNVSGMKHLEIVKATQAAWAAGKNVPTSSVSENLASIRELRMVFGDTQHAIAYMPVVQKAQAVLANLKGGNAKSESYEMAKALEMKGAVKNPGDFMNQADLMTKAMIASGGKVSSGDFLSTFKYARAATSGWSDQFTYSILPTLIQEMKARGGSGGGGGGPGNALMSAYAAVVGGTVPQKALQVWDKLGMLDKSKVVWTKDGHAKGLAPGGISGSADFMSNPYEWTQKYLVPALQKAGYTTEAGQKQALQYLFPNRTAGFVMSQFVTQGWKFQRDQKLISDAQGIGAYGQLLKNDPEMAAMALQKQWQSLLAILGFQIMPTLLKGAQWLIDAFRSMAVWVKENAVLAKVLVLGFAGLSAAMAFGGTVIVLSAAFRGLGLALAFTGIGGLPGIAGLATQFVVLGAAMKTAFGWVSALALAGAAGYAVGGVINKHLPDGAGNAIGSFLVHGAALLGNQDAQGAVATQDKYTRSHAQVSGKIRHGDVYIDGKKAGVVLTPHVTAQQSKAANRPQSGASFHDGSMGLPAVAGGR